jgi:SAM-dependent methyltransferase
LDVGCSIGAFAFALAPHVDQVVGFDIEEEAIACALLWKEHADHANTEFFVLDAVAQPDRLAAYAGFFDAIVLKDVIEHVASMENVTRLLSVLRPLVRPGGVIYIETPNYALPFEPHLHMIMPPVAAVPTVRKLARLIGKHGTSDDSFFRTLHIFSPGAFEDAARGLGFRVHNVILEHKLPRLVMGAGSTQASHRSLRTPLRMLHAMHMGRFATWIIAMFRLYPTLVYVLK